MLPMPIRTSYERSTFSEYAWRVMHPTQMDFQFAVSQMCDLLHNPSEVYKTTSIRKQIKDAWSRDDPAFVLLELGLMMGACLAWLIGFGAQSVTHAFCIVVGGPLIQFLLVGYAMSALIRFYANTSMRIIRLHATDQIIESLYAFDVHCNAFFPTFCLLFAFQYFITPIILQPGFVALLLGNSLYLAAVAVYAYVTFLGYAALPFIERPERLLYPVTITLALYVITLLLQINVAQWVISFYFGSSYVEPINWTKVHSPLSSNATLKAGSLAG